MVLLACLPGTETDPIDIAFRRGHHLPCGQRGDTECINHVRFGESSMFAIRCCFVAEHGGQRSYVTQCGIEMRLALHATLRDLIQVPTHPCHLELKFPLVES